MLLLVSLLYAGVPALAGGLANIGIIPVMPSLLLKASSFLIAGVSAIADVHAVASVFDVAGFLLLLASSLSTVQMYMYTCPLL